jgi:hypothetical protein
MRWVPAVVLLLAVGGAVACRSGPDGGTARAASPAAAVLDEQAARERAVTYVRRNGSPRSAQAESVRLLTVAELRREPGLENAVPSGRHAPTAPVYLVRVHAPGAVASSCPCNPDAAVAADWWYVVLDAADGAPLAWLPAPAH